MKMKQDKSNKIKDESENHYVESEEIYNYLTEEELKCLKESIERDK